MGCLACFGAGADVSKEAAASKPPPPPARANRLNLAPQDLYHVDEFPMDLEEAQRWVVVRKAKPDAKYRMLCLPWAGGSSTIYTGYDLPNTEVVAVELPGRQARMRERPMESVYHIVGKLAEAAEVLGYLRSNAKPLIIMGHSFGSLLAIHLAWALRTAYGFTPYYLVLAGGIPPHARWDTKVAIMDDQKLIDTLVDYGGIPAELSKNAEMMATHLPVIRADYHCVDFYLHIENVPPVSCPIVAMGGTLDDMYGPKVAATWAPYTTSTFTLRAINGASHFFPKSRKDDVLAIINNVCLEGKTQSDPEDPSWIEAEKRDPPRLYTGNAI